MEHRIRMSMSEFLGDLCGVVVSPSRRFALIHERGAAWGSLFLLIAPAYLALHFLGGIYFDADPFPGYSWLIPLIGAGVLTYIKLCFIHILARLFEGRGRYASATGRFRDLLVVFGYSGVPSILATLLALGTYLSLASHIGNLMHSFRVPMISILVAVGIAFFIWHLVLMVLCLRHVYPMRDWKIVVSVLVGPILASVSSLLLMQISSSAKVETTFVRTIVNDRLIAMVEGEPIGEGKHPRIGIYLDLLSYRYRTPLRSDIVAFPPPVLAGGMEKGGGDVAAGEPGFLWSEKQNLVVGRVVGLPGETIELAEGEFRVNGQAWREAYLGGTAQTAISEGPLILGPGQYLILPENRSMVSGHLRDWIVTLPKIQGRVILNRWPLGWWLYKPAAHQKAVPLR